MPGYVARILWSFVSLVLLLVLVFFLSRLTGDPATLFLPIDATPQMIEQFRELIARDLEAAKKIVADAKIKAE